MGAVEEVEDRAALLLSEVKSRAEAEDHLEGVSVGEGGETRDDFPTLRPEFRMDHVVEIDNRVKGMEGRLVQKR